VDELEAKGIMNTGSFNKGGSVATAGGVLFIGATYDSRFHAFESKTGKLLWETKLGAAAQANPITYIGKNGKQYVAIAVGDTLGAFALPSVQKRKIKVISLEMACPFSRAGSNSQN
jgi:quinoprotein glucose dehydrogenase